MKLRMTYMRCYYIIKNAVYEVLLYIQALVHQGQTLTTKMDQMNGQLNCKWSQMSRGDRIPTDYTVDYEQIAFVVTHIVQVADQRFKLHQPVTFPFHLKRFHCVLNF